MIFNLIGHIHKTKPMIDLNTTNEWQYRDSSNGLVLPWYTKSFLDELVTWDLSDKVVFEYGAGASTLWWAKKAKQVYSVESNPEWWREVHDAVKHTTAWVKIAEGRWLFEDAIHEYGILFDVIIVDSEPIEWRGGCITEAITRLKPGGKLIIDNWMQPSVGWLPSEETQRIVTSLPHVIYSQEGHPDWKTLVATKP